MELSMYELLGIWFSIFLTLCIFSFLYQDNPVYKFAEHLYVGVSIGVAVVEQWYSVLVPNLLEPLQKSEGSWLSRVSPWIALLLVVMLFAKLVPKYSYLARTPIALLVSAFAAVKLTGEASGNLMIQVADSMPNLKQVYEQHGMWSWAADGAGVFSALLLVVGLVSCLVYFYFSVPHEGPLRYVSRFGVWVLMVSFGASFGYTVMGRISLAYGRMLTLVGLDRPAAEAAQVNAPLVSLISVVVIVGVIAAWKMRLPPEQTPEGSA